MLVPQTPTNRCWSRRGTFAFHTTTPRWYPIPVDIDAFALPSLPPPTTLPRPVEVLSFRIVYKCAVGLEASVILYLMIFNVCASFLTSISFA